MVISVATPIAMPTVDRNARMRLAAMPRSAVPAAEASSTATRRPPRHAAPRITPSLRPWR